MSHSIYNPIIYCYMNARFRSGFIQVLFRIPGMRRCYCLKKLRGNGESMAVATGLVTGEIKIHRHCTNHNCVVINNDEDYDDEGTEFNDTPQSYRMKSSLRCTHFNKNKNNFLTFLQIAEFISVLLSKFYVFEYFYILLFFI